MPNFKLWDENTIKVQQDLVDVLLARALLVENLNKTTKEDMRRILSQALDGVDQKIAGEMEYEGFEHERYIVEKTHFAIAELRKAHDRAWRVISDIALASIPIVEDDV